MGGDRPTVLHGVQEAIGNESSFEAVVRSDERGVESICEWRERRPDAVVGLQLEALRTGFFEIMEPSVLNNFTEAVGS